MHRAARCCADKTFLCFIGAACVWTALYTVVESASSCIDYQLFASHASWYRFGDEVLSRQRLRSHGKYNDRIFVIMPHLNTQREMRPIVTHVAWSVSLIGSYTLPITSVQSLSINFSPCDNACNKYKLSQMDQRYLYLCRLKSINCFITISEQSNQKSARKKAIK